MKKLSFILFPAILFTFFNACKSDDPVPENPEELITTLQIVFIPDGGGVPVNFTFEDLDGDGGNMPLISTGFLSAQTEYHATLSMLDKTKIPIKDIIDEVLAEDEDHQFFFQASGVQMTHTYDDMDGDGNPIGIVNTFVTGDAGNGTLKVTLRHEPDKTGTGVSDGDITNAGGETDIEVVFPVTIL